MGSECLTVWKCPSLVNILGKVAELCGHNQVWTSLRGHAGFPFCPTFHQTLPPTLCSSVTKPLIGPHTVCCLGAFAQAGLGLDWNALLSSLSISTYQLQFSSALTAFRSLNTAMMKNVAASQTKPNWTQIFPHSQSLCLPIPQFPHLYTKSNNTKPSGLLESERCKMLDGWYLVPRQIQSPCSLLPDSPILPFHPRLGWVPLSSTILLLHTIYFLRFISLF